MPSCSRARFGKTFASSDDPKRMITSPPMCTQLRTSSLSLLGKHVKSEHTLGMIVSEQEVVSLAPQDVRGPPWNR